VNAETLEQALERLRRSRLATLDIAGLFARSEMAHKWKATFRSLLLRETVFWRLEDLLQQSYALHKMGHSLGALIILRSALETIATLIYLNQLTVSVLDGTLEFRAFGEKTGVLLLGSRNKSTEYSAINILTILQKCTKRYEYIENFYADLSECAHPNCEGLVLGYSRPDRENLIENFSNHWSAMYSRSHDTKMWTVIMIFEHEYNDVWPREFQALEKWLEDHNEELEASASRLP
jgi:hypothetical protein